jgi:hypothetical protein
MYSAGGREYVGGDGRSRQDWSYETMLLTLQGDKWREVSLVQEWRWEGRTGLSYETMLLTLQGDRWREVSLAQEWRWEEWTGLELRDHAAHSPG